MSSHTYGNTEKGLPFDDKDFQTDGVPTKVRFFYKKKDKAILSIGVQYGQKLHGQHGGKDDTAQMHELNLKKGEYIKSVKLSSDDVGIRQLKFISSEGNHTDLIGKDGYGRIKRIDFPPGFGLTYISGFTYIDIPPGFGLRPSNNFVKALQFHYAGMEAQEEEKEDLSVKVQIDVQVNEEAIAEQKREQTLIESSKGYQEKYDAAQQSLSAEGKGWGFSAKTAAAWSDSSKNTHSTDDSAYHHEIVAEKYNEGTTQIIVVETYIFQIGIAASTVSNRYLKASGETATPKTIEELSDLRKQYLSANFDGKNDKFELLPQ